MTRPSHAGSGRATVGMPRVADIGGMYGDAMGAIVKGGTDWFNGIVAVGRAMQGKSAKIEAAAEREDRKRQSEALSISVDSYNTSITGW